mgnify:CR=1 FL=1
MNSDAVWEIAFPIVCVIGPLAPIICVAFLVIWLRNVRKEIGYGRIWCGLAAVFLLWTIYAFWDLIMLLLNAGLGAIAVLVFVWAWTATNAAAPLLTVAICFFPPRKTASQHRSTFAIRPFSKGLVVILVGMQFLIVTRIAIITIILQRYTSTPINIFGHPPYGF